jgi:predicted CoA-binding protein
MPHINPSDQELKRILISAQTIAMVGASSNPEKPSHGIMRQLLAAGYRVIPVNPSEKEVHGHAAVAALTDIAEKVDIVDVFRRAEYTPPIAEQTAAIKAPVLWLQLGIINEETARRGKALGLTVIMDRCIGETHRKLSIPTKSPR